MNTLDQDISIYFNTHQSQLAQNYPGINLKFFKEKFKDYCQSVTNLDFSGSSLNFLADTRAFFKRCEEGEPLEYISRKSYFYNANFFIDQRVLIPRFESEVLVQTALDMITKEKINHIREVGSGSGCLGLSIAQEYKLKKLELIDISKDAQDVSKINYHRLIHKIGKDTVVEFINADFLKFSAQPVPCIISNPPYIKSSETNSLVHKNTDSYEPHVALYLGDHEYDLWYELFFKNCYEQLSSGGVLIMEGSENHLQKLKSLASKLGYSNIKIKQDLTQRDRLLVARK